MILPGFVSFLNSLLGWFGGLVGAPYLSFEFLLGLGIAIILFWAPFLYLKMKF